MIWFQQSYVTKAQVSGGTYAEAVKGPIDTLNPLYATTPAELSAGRLLFSSLFKPDVTGHVRGDIAMTMTNDSDKIFVVKMRKDARWHDGDKLTADDVVYTVGLMKDPAVRSVMTASWRGVAVEKIDDYTVKFTLPAAYAAFPQALTFSILPKHVLESVDSISLRETAFSKSPIGSGPFSVRLLQVISQDSGRKVVHLDANKDYYAGIPRLERFQIHAYADYEAIGVALRTGEVTGASNITSEVAQTINQNQYKTIVKPVNNGVYALFNLSQPYLQDSNVRRALQLAADTSEVRKKIYGNPKELYLPFIPTQVTGAKDIPAPTIDPKLAAELLEKSGWVMQDGIRTKDGEPLRLRIVTRKNSDFEAALQTIVGQWRKLGVEIDSVIFDTTDATVSFATDILQRRDYDVLIDELVIGADPDVFAYWHTKGLLNFANYTNQTSDDALTSARTRSEAVLRSVKYLAFAKQWLADVPAIGLYQTNYVYAHSKTARTIEPDQVIVTPDEHYADIRYWTAEQDTVYKTP